MPKRVIGIDLGATNSAVAAMEDGEVPARMNYLRSIVAACFYVRLLQKALSAVYGANR